MSDSVAVIPARGGSRRVPRKNVRDFAGKPMLAWSIEAARACGEFDAIVVSTDDPEIAEIARRWGAEVPYERPAALADDHTGLMPVLQHAIGWLNEAGRAPELVGCLYATAPFLRADDLKAAARAWRADAHADFVLAVCEFPSPAQRAFAAGETGYLRFLQPELALTRSQDLCPTYHDAGQFILGDASAFLGCRTTLDARTLPFPLPPMRCRDIDTPEDWEQALLLWDVLKRQESSAP